MNNNMIHNYIAKISNLRVWFCPLIQMLRMVLDGDLSCCLLLQLHLLQTKQPLVPKQCTQLCDHGRATQPLKKNKIFKETEPKRINLDINLLCSLLNLSTKHELCDQLSMTQTSYLPCERVPYVPILCGPQTF